MTSVTLQNVSKRYGATVAVTGLTLAIESGELLAVVGPSGCGKTTTLRLIAGLERADCGDVIWDARQVTHQPPSARDVAMVFQSQALYPHLTVQGNLAFSARLRRVPEAEIRRRCEEAAQRLELADLLQRYPAQLSSGQRQRVALGRALVRRSRVLLLDEPLNNLDGPLRDTIRQRLIQALEQQGTTTVYVTHDQHEALLVGRRIAVMHEGCVRQLGTPIDIYHHPKSRWVAGFFGEPRMNFLSGLLLPQQRGRRLLRMGSSEFPWSPAGPLDQYADGVPVTIGIRPEDLCLNGGQSEVMTRGDWLLDAQLQTCRDLGAFRLLEVTFQSQVLVARIADRVNWQPHAKVVLRVAPERVHLFDAEGERRL